MTLAEAFVTIASVVVPGVKTSYTNDNVPNVLAEANLPALIPSWDSVIYQKDNYGTSNGATGETHIVKHILAYSKAKKTKNKVLSSSNGLVAVLDAYKLAFSTLPTTPGACTLQLAGGVGGTFELGGTTYNGAIFDLEVYI